MRHLTYPNNGYLMKVVTIKSVSLDNDLRVRFGRGKKSCKAFENVTDASLERVCRLINMSDETNGPLVNIFPDRSFSVCRTFFVRDDTQLLEQP